MQVNLQVKRDSWWSVRQFAVYTSLGGFSEGDELYISVKFEKSDKESHVLSLSRPADDYAAISGSLEIRLVGYAGRYGGHEVALEEFSLVAGNETYQLTLLNIPPLRIGWREAYAAATCSSISVWIPFRRAF